MKLKMLHYHPNEEYVEQLANLNKSEFLFESNKRLTAIAEHQFLQEEKTDTEKTQTTYRTLIEQARIHECESSFCEMVDEIEQANNVLFWALPKPLQVETNEYSFPVNALPTVLRDYVAAVSKFGQVPVEMCALPLLSVIALCCQGKCKVKNHKSSFTHELTLYTLTVASSGARKSPALSYFMKPVYDFQNSYNENHELERKQNQSTRQFIEEQKRREMKSKNGNLDKIKDFDKQLDGIPELHRLSLTITDVTPEALAQAMDESNGKMAIMDSEGGVLGTVAGMYNGGASNIDLLLKAYDGEFVEVRRKTSGAVTLKRPLLTFGLLTQPKKFNEFITNNEFEEKGLLNRFLFAFPKAPKRYTDSVPEIPKEAQSNYNKLIERLLSMPETDAIIGHSEESTALFHDLHEYIQDSKQSGGIFEFVSNYAEKQLANALKIAALLHLCEHTPEEPINKAIADSAIAISIWCFNQAVKAFSNDIGENPVYILSNKIIEKMCKSKQEVFTFRDLKRAFHVSSGSDKETELKEAIETLIDCYYIKDNGKKFGENGYNMRINPILKTL